MVVVYYCVVVGRLIWGGVVIFCIFCIIIDSSIVVVLGIGVGMMGVKGMFKFVCDYYYWKGISGYGSVSCINVVEFVLGWVFIV